MSLRSRLAILVLATLMLAGGALPAAGADYHITGAGWGHGVGLSQYGAKAMAADGASYDQILHRYFTGVTISPVATAVPGTFVATDPTPLWVGLLQDSSAVTFAVGAGTARLCFDQADYCVASAQPGETYRFLPDGTGSCVFMRTTAARVPTTLGQPGACDASVRPDSDATTIDIPFKARSYRFGTLRFRPVPGGSGIHTVYEIGVEDYMKGLSEVPESWPMAALEAQVVVSRSYAVRTALDRGDTSTLDASRKAECYCNLRDDASDQVFRGWTGQSTHPQWVAAVESTTQQVVAAGGTVALGIFSSSSGGWTENYSDVFGGTGHPYLSTVKDSPAFSDAAANPHATWSAGYDQATLASAFGFSWLSAAEVIDRNASGSARTVRLTGIIGGRPAETVITGVEMRAALSLRSTAFDIVTHGRYSDLPAGHAFAGEVLGLDTLGITRGCTDDRYCPDRPVTRAEMAAFLVRAFELPTAPEAEPYGDDDGHALEADIETLYANGITTGCAPKKFCPERAVTRAEMAAFLVRSLGLALEVGGDPFDDTEGNYLEAEIAALADSGITSGCSATQFCPDMAVTRGEMAAFLIRALAS